MRLVCVLGVMASLISTSVLGAGDMHHCARCGGAVECRMTCRLVREQKKIEVVCYGEKKEEFCIPCPSKPGCGHEERVCDSCEKKEAGSEVTSKSKVFFWRDWVPGGASLHARTRLMKRVETKMVPTYKWVVEDLCPACQAKTSEEAKKPVAEK